MKNIVLVVTIIPLLTLLSCSDWLDVKPKSEIKLDVMFETEQGFKDALTGCYIMLSDNSLYGAEMTCTFMDVLAQQYALLGSTSSQYEQAARYIYTNSTSETIIKNIWSKLYNVIANVNALIEGLEAKRENLHPSIYAMTKAEAYSLRAFIYFDLVRMFTWGNLAERSDKLQQLSIPYAKVYDKDIIKQSKLSEVLEYIHEDIETALELFDAYDPDSQSGNRPEGYTLPNDDKFYDKEIRIYRMSLKSTLATRMRLNMWEGNYDAAYEDAITLIPFQTDWVSGLDGNEKDRDLTFSKEMLFGVQTHERFENIVKKFFKLTAADDLNMNYQALYLPDSRVNDIFEIATNVGASDWRYTRLWDKSEKNYVFLKFWEYEKMSYTNIMPLIKWPEVYYTLTECLLRKGGSTNKNLAIDHLNTVRNHRNIPASVNLQYTLSGDEVWDELRKEWQKEFIGDGQMFYYYKRNGYASIPNGPALTYDDKVYVFPLPQAEIDFGGRVELVDNENK